MGTYKLFKYEALGNDMIVLDPAEAAILPTDSSIRLLCDRHRGLGADGLCYGPLPDAANHLRMRFFNPDGSEAEKSGNGLRIFARYLIDAGYIQENQHTFEISINNELVKVERLDQAGHRLAISMGALSFCSDDVGMSGPSKTMVNQPLDIAGGQLLVTAVSVGNPHCVLFDIDAEQIHTLGPLIERSTHFANRINVQIAEVLDESTIRIVIWERGAGYTLASGTSACASAGAAVRNGLCSSPITVIMDGGHAQVAIDEAWHVTLTGEVSQVFIGDLAPDLLHQLAAS